MPFTNYHSHTHFSDGVMQPETYVAAAIVQQMPQYGFSDHAPIDIKCDWDIPKERLDEYLNKINQLKQLHQNEIEILCSLEVDYIPKVITPADFRNRLDYCVSSVHFGAQMSDGNYWAIDGPTKGWDKGLNELFDGNVQKGVSSYFELTQQLLHEDAPDILGHMDKVKMHNKNKFVFSEEDEWYKKLLIDTLHLIKEKNVIVEINTRGKYKKISDVYPSSWVWKELYKLNIPIVINSDCHHPREITRGFTWVAKGLLDIGYKEMMYFQDGAFVPKPFNEKGLIL